MDNLGTRLKELRLKNGYTQEFLSKEFNVTRQTVSKWENNKTTPDIETLKKFCAFYSIDMDFLVNKNKVKKKDSYFLLGLVHFINIFVNLLSLFEFIQMNFFNSTHGIVTWITLLVFGLLGVINYFYIYYSYVKEKELIYTIIFPIVVLLLLSR